MYLGMSKIVYFNFPLTWDRPLENVCLINTCACILVCGVPTCGVDGHSVNASVLGLQLLKKSTHVVTERLQSELTALSSRRQTYWDHGQAILIHHGHICKHTFTQLLAVTAGQRVIRFMMVQWDSSLAQVGSVTKVLHKTKGKSNGATSYHADNKLTVTLMVIWLAYLLTQWNVLKIPGMSTSDCEKIQCEPIDTMHTKPTPIYLNYINNLGVHLLAISDLSV